MCAGQQLVEDFVELLPHGVEFQTCVDDAKAARVLAGTLAIASPYGLKKGYVLSSLRLML